MFGANEFDDYRVLNYLHGQIMSPLQGPWGQRDPELTRSALARPYRSAFGEEVYGNHFQKAAALMDAIINNVVFKDGNKRTALAAAALYLAINGCVIKVTRNESEYFTHYMVTAKPSISEVAFWLQSHASRVNTLLA